MSDYKERQENEIFTKVLKAGRRTYFFDVRETKAGDYYLTITESNETKDFIIEQKGEDVISEKHDKDFKSRSFTIDSDEDF